MNEDEKLEHGAQPRPQLNTGEDFRTAVMLWENNQPQAAADVCRKILGATPHHAQAMNLLGMSLNKLGLSSQALKLVQQALILKPGLPHFMNSMGLVLNSLTRYAEALDFYKRVLSSLPGDAVNEKSIVLNNMGNALKDMGHLDEALAHYDMVKQLGIDNAPLDWNRSQVLLAQGRFDDAWPGYERRFELANSRQRFYPHILDVSRWNGSPFSGRRLFIHDEQGLGDTVQFARFIPMVKLLGGEIILEVRPALFELFKSLSGVDRLVVREAVPSKLDFELTAPIMSLANLLNVTLESIPAEIPYLKASKDSISKWKNIFSGSNFRVGLVWACNQNNVPTRDRTVSLDALLPLLEIPGISFHGFQKDDASGQIEQLPAEYRFPNHGENFVDFGDTAGALAHLDLLISVDTSVAHVAGALGIPTWILLPQPSDWRWLIERDDSPWYPDVRLFRCRKPGGWDHVVNLVVTELRRLTRKS